MQDTYVHIQDIYVHIQDTYVHIQDTYVHIQDTYVHIQDTYSRLINFFLFTFTFYKTSETESPMSVNYLTTTPPKERFALEQINSAPYLRLVKRTLAKDLEFKTVDATVFHSLARTYDRNGGSIGKVVTPFYDAACLVLNKPREGFDANTFYTRYPSALTMVKTFQKKIGIH